MDHAKSSLTSGIDYNQVVLVFSSRCWVLDSPFVAIKLYHNDRAKRSKDNGTLATESYRCAAVDNPFHIKVSDHETT
jgi:hypothetical protein